MDNYRNQYPYGPYPYSYPHPPYDQQHSLPPDLYASHSFNAPPTPSIHHPPPQFNHSGPLQYLPPPFYEPAYDPYYRPRPPPSGHDCPPQYSPPPFYELAHEPNYRPPPPPTTSNSFYPYGHPFPQDPVPSPNFPSSSTAPPAPSTSFSSSLYPPIDNLLDDMHLSSPSPPPVSAPQSNMNSSLNHHNHRHHHSCSSISSSSPVSTTPQSPFSPSPSHLQMAPFQQGKVSLKVLLLHGNLDVWILEARNLPNLDMFSKTITDMIGPHLTSSLSGKLEKTNMTSDPYVSIVVSGATVGRTYVMSNSENPVWNQHFNVPVAHYAAEVEFFVKDSDVVGSQMIGRVSIPAELIHSVEKVEGMYPVLGVKGKPCKEGAVLRLSIQYIPIDRQSMHHNGVGAGPDYFGVPGTYFPLRRGGSITLYQDAHVPDGCLPDLRLDNGMHYLHGKCWQDIFEAISQARRLVYIAGWSVFHTVRLVRNAAYGSSGTLGDVLKSKSQEGVRVLLLVWDDPTSRSILGFQTNGLMGTRDEETRRFFKHSSVQVILCPRSAGKRHSWAKQQETGTIYTHHQKTVIVDADAGNYKRKIVAFIGGLDLCGGRYDTPSHPLFSTLQTLHKDDFRNKNFAAPDPSGPREPWHDLHSKIDGPAAYDVLTNFEERWLKASKRHVIRKLKKSDDSLLKLERIPDIIGLRDILYVNDNDPETWHAQVFRSIDSNSVRGFPKDPKEATSKNLVCGKNVLIDMSIHTAYVKAIRSAQHFIYIENQYFLGSSYNWDTNKDLGANNLIPMEISLKIANKIKANERFSAYIVIPMWPEGNPTGTPTQRILFWQKKTMQMMYETIYKALKEVGLENTYEPQDYLNFFCLGVREASDSNDVSNGNTAAANSPNALARKNRRFMIYVHSKGMIVDDEYVIVGSANINQRSLEGTRDTEIAMGAYQPQHTWARKACAPQGQIYGYRMSLWAEHIGTLEECFSHPESLECMRRVRTLGELNWKQYVAEGSPTEMRGHLLKYPVDVDRKGKVKPLPGCETFPDIGGNICGSFLAIKENLTI